MNNTSSSTNGQVNLEIALLALKLGFSPIPPREDGSKAPIGAWKNFQTAPASRNQIIQWYSGGRTGNGLVCGVGNLECFEFDDGATHHDFLEAAWSVGLGEIIARIQEGYWESTPGGGHHWLYRCSDGRGNTKLACRPKLESEFTDKDREVIGEAAKNGRAFDPIKVLIETRGQGGFVITAPSNGGVHPSGGAYKLLAGGLESIATITPEERDALWELARTFDAMPVLEATGKVWAGPDVILEGTDPAGKPKEEISPGDDYEERMTWADVLEPFGWVAVYRRGDEIWWRRPGKDTGWSATTGHCKGLKVFSSSVAGLGTEGTHTKFHVFTVLQHGGDYSASTKALAAAGYGSPSRPAKRPVGRPRKNPLAESKDVATVTVESQESNGKPEETRVELGEEPIIGKGKLWAPCFVNSKIWLRANSKKIEHDLFLRTIFVDGEPVKDGLIIHIAGLIEKEVRVPWEQSHVRSAIVDIASEHAFNPLQDWLNGLVWDGVDRVATFFEDAYRAGRTAYAIECARVLMLQAVARALLPGCQADVMVVLIGDQGILKSTGIAALCPHPGWFAEDLGSEITSSKGAGEGLQGKWIVECSELARMTDRTLETVKSFVTRRIDRYRPSYGRLSEDFPRTCVFVGTTNNEHFLRDNENRRFMPIHVKQGNIAWIKEQRDQLWAEAVHRFNAGENWWTIEPDRLKECVEHQARATMPDAWEEILEAKLAGVVETTVVKSAELLGLYDDRPGLPAINRIGKSEETRIGFVLRKLGFRRNRVRENMERAYVYSRSLP